MVTEEDEGSGEPREKPMQELIGSRSWVESNSDIEVPATSWPKRKSDDGESQ